MTYKIKYAHSGAEDIRNMKEYILRTFKYHVRGERFTEKMKAATNKLKTLPKGYGTIDFQYCGYDIYLKPYRT